MHAVAGRRRKTAPIPDRVGRHEILLPIASGGTATVYLARTRGAHGFEREVALKLIHAHLLDQDADAWAASFIEEAKLAARVRHPNVVPVLDIGDDRLGIFLVMEYVEGEALSGLLGEGKPRIPTPIALRILCDALAGLHAVHELRGDSGALLGVVHRDFSPQNVLVGTDGMSRLTDFGVAKATDRLDATKTGALKGKLGYMSPEQIRAQRLDRRCDVWAAGVVAWEVLTGRRLFPHDDDPIARLLRICSQAPPRLRDVVPSASPALEEAVAWALTLDRDRRCPTADALRAALAEAWSKEGVLPEASEVGRFVLSAVAPKLEERRARIEAAVGVRTSDPTASRATPAGGRFAVLGRDHAETGDTASGERSLAGSSSTASTTKIEPRLRVPATARAENGPPAGGGTTPAVRAAGLAVVLGGVAIFAATARWTHSESADVAAPASAASAAAEQAFGSAAPTSASEAAAAPEPTLRLSANVPIAFVSMGQRAIEIPTPSTEVTVALSQLEAEGDTPIEAVSLDGRRARTVVPAGSDAVHLVFGAARGQAPAKPRARATKPGSSGVPMAGNPYGKPR